MKNTSNQGGVYLLRIDSEGKEIWSNEFGGPGWDNGFDIQRVSDGGYIITGITKSIDTVGYDVYLVKTDAEGNEV